METQESSVNRVVVVSGGFDPVHAGHISMIKQARTLGDYLVVGVNSDEWLSRKKGRAFMPWSHRAEIMANLVGVDQVLSFDDTDGSARDLLLKVKKQHSSKTIVFANGGDRTVKNIPEMSVVGVDFVFGIGGSDKLGSSSNFLQNWKDPVVDRSWGTYRVIYENKHEIAVKVKELVVEPEKSLSMQKHQHRSEYWFVTQGDCQVKLVTDQGEDLVNLSAGQDLLIRQGDWHKLQNPYKTHCKIIEIQFGHECEEQDIQRQMDNASQ